MTARAWIADRLAHAPRPTWFYESATLLACEVLAFGASLWAAPTLRTWVLGVFGMVASMEAQVIRSTAARKRELGEARGDAPLVLACHRREEASARRLQLIAITTPVITAAFSDGFAVGAVLVLASAPRVAFLVRYGAWRAWYRRQRPLVLPTQREALDNAVVAIARWLATTTWPVDLEAPEAAARRVLSGMYVRCPGCDGGGFSGYGSGYDAVCGSCGGQSASYRPSAEQLNRRL